MKNHLKDPLVFSCDLLLFQKSLTESHPMSGGFSAPPVVLFSLFEQLSQVTLLNTIPRPLYLEFYHLTEKSILFEVLSGPFNF